MASDRYTVGAPTGPAVHVQIRSGLLTVDPTEARRLAHALLDAIGDRSEAEAIVRDLAESRPIDAYYEDCTLCGADQFLVDRHETDCPYLRARAFVAREGREDTDHE